MKPAPAARREQTTARTPLMSPAQKHTTALSFSLKLTVSAEVLANTYQSIGGMMQEAKIYVEVPALFALTALVVIAGFLLEGLGAAAAYAARRRI